MQYMDGVSAPLCAHACWGGLRMYIVQAFCTEMFIALLSGARQPRFEVCVDEKTPS